MNLLQKASAFACAKDSVFNRLPPAADVVHSCNCIGPQDGQPVCPCQMRFVSVVNGRYVKTTDLGPAPKPVGQWEG